MIGNQNISKKSIDKKDKQNPAVDKGEQNDKIKIILKL
jgi:hypothetical protein